eukprot:1260105-Rhodomonas_salina.1
MSSTENGMTLCNVRYRHVKAAQQTPYSWHADRRSDLEGSLFEHRDVDACGRQILQLPPNPLLQPPDARACPRGHGLRHRHRHRRVVRGR